MLILINRYVMNSYISVGVIIFKLFYNLFKGVKPIISLTESGEK